MNIDQASHQSFARPAASASRLRSFLLALGLAAFALVALVATAILLFLSARAQMQFQVSPTDIKYGPAQRIPTSTPDSRATGNDEDDEDADSSPERPASSGGGIIPGIPGISGGPLFPSSPQAPAYTPAPAAPARNEPAPSAQPAAPGTSDVSDKPPAEKVARPRKSGPETAAPPDAGRVRRVGSKSFKRDEKGVLVDASYVPNGGQKEVTVVAGSDEYVRLLEDRKDLRPYFRLDDQLIVVVDNVVYRVVPKD